MRTLHTFALALAITSLACQPMPQQSDTGTPSPQQTPASDVTIALDRTTYSPGGQVELRVTNHTNETLGFNPCTRSIEQRQGESWSLIVEPGRVCTMQLYIIQPHATRNEITDLPTSLERGTYRIALGFTREGPSVTPPTPAPAIRAVSAPFQVE